MSKKTSQEIAKSIRNYRKVHRYLGLILVLLLLISAVTGVLLGWKKNVNLLQPETQKGISLDINEWQPVKQLEEKALLAVDSLGLSASNLDRIEYRPTKGIAKVIFDTGSWEVQIDATNLEILSVAKRNSDWIEQIHDGSIISDFFKIFSMNFLGFGLIILLITGIWLWYGPKKMRKVKS